jgi:hypothetical protein
VDVESEELDDAVKALTACANYGALYLKFLHDEASDRHKKAIEASFQAGYKEGVQQGLEQAKDILDQSGVFGKDSRKPHENKPGQS